MGWRVYDGQVKAHAEIVKHLITFGMSNKEAQKEATKKLNELRDCVPGVYYVDAGYTIIKVRVK